MSIWYAWCSFGSFVRKYEKTEKYFGRIQNWDQSHRRNNGVTVGFFKVGEKKKRQLRRNRRILQNQVVCRTLPRRA